MDGQVGEQNQEDQKGGSKEAEKEWKYGKGTLKL